ncbi:MAG: 2-C-methyl-D-erythritol 2,4-cyclodiphosphate synthase, partial [Pseudomonadota bacterium]
VHIIPGERSNLKLTYLQDLAIAGALIRTSHCATPPLLRVGHGYDLHPIQDGGMLILCATQLDCGFSLKGHSDADVALHALCDAILGAISAGDIGDHFPPDEARWKDCGSSHFVRHAIGLAANRGYRLANCDITMITEKPKIAPLRQNMQHAVANLLDVQPDMVSIKATTNEKLGAIGRMEAIAALATVTLVA